MTEPSREPRTGRPPGKIPLVMLTHSRTRALRMCARYHWFRYEVGVRPIPKREGANALNIGSAYHEALEVMQKPGDGDADALIRAMLRTYVIAERLDVTEATIVYELARGWFAKWKGVGYEPVGVEVPFSFPIDGIHGYRNAGKIDAIGEAGGKLYLVEHKTTADSLDPAGDYWRPLRFDTQLSRYFNAARKLGYDVKGILYDVTRKPAIRPRKLTKAEIEDIVEGQRYSGLEVTSDAELVRVRGERDASLEKAPKKVPEIRESAYLYSLRLRSLIASDPDRYYARMNIPRLEADLEEHEDSVKGDVALHRHMVKSGHWPRNDAACFRMGTCRYLELCANRIDPRETVPDGFEKLEDVHPELESST